MHEIDIRKLQQTIKNVQGIFISQSTRVGFVDKNEIVGDLCSLKKAINIIEVRGIAFVLDAYNSLFKDCVSFALACGVTVNSHFIENYAVAFLEQDSLPISQIKVEVATLLENIKNALSRADFYVIFKKLGILHGMLKS